MDIGGDMDKDITRREFLKKNIVMLTALFFAKHLSHIRSSFAKNKQQHLAHKEARYYKELAG